jgi:hypothetical protein
LVSSACAVGVATAGDAVGALVGATVGWGVAKMVAGSGEARSATGAGWFVGPHAPSKRTRRRPHIYRRISFLWIKAKAWFVMQASRFTLRGVEAKAIASSPPRILASAIR